MGTKGQSKAHPRRGEILNISISLQMANIERKKNSNLSKMKA
jgi:hypothetical protein